MSTPSSNIIYRCTAIWAFCESGIGGILHLFKVPFSGILLTGLSVWMITLIQHFSDRKFSIISGAFLQVLIIKFIISPHSPPFAYIALFFQFIFSIFIFRLFRINLFSILLVAVVTFLESAFQKVITLTIFFGLEFWDALNQLYAKSVKSLFPDFISSGTYLAISIYGLVYIIFSVAISFYIYNFWRRVQVANIGEVNWAEDFNNVYQKNQFNHSPLRRIISYFIISLIIGGFLYLLGVAQLPQYLSYILRTLVILLLWFFIIVPLFRILLGKWIRKADTNLINKSHEFIRLFPWFRQRAMEVWQLTKDKNILLRIFYFFDLYFQVLLIGEVENHKNEKH